MARFVTERADVVPQLAELFREYGFVGTSLTLITAHTGLGKGSLYHFFPGGKEEMAEAVLADISGWFESNVFLPLQQDDPSSGIAQMFRDVLAYFRSGRRTCLVGAFALDHSRDQFRLHIAGYFERWVSALSLALQQSGIAREDAGELAQEVVAGIQGAIVLSRAVDDLAVFTTILRRLEERCRVSTIDVLEKSEFG